MAASPDKGPDADPKGSAPGTGMDTGEMKQLLNKSKRNPVNCAVATSADGSLGLLLMHVTKKPQALVKDLLKSIPGAKNTRWGTAAVDQEADPKLVTFSLNKPMSSLDRKLIKTLKGTGFSKVDISD
jgi:hypothetical protein